MSHHYPIYDHEKAPWWSYHEPVRSSRPSTEKAAPDDHTRTGLYILGWNSNKKHAWVDVLFYGRERVYGPNDKDKCRITRVYCNANGGHFELKKV